MKLAVNNIMKKYNKKVLNNISVDLISGNIYCLLGKNGAGKTTLMKIISGILKPNCGSIITNDTYINNFKNMYYVSEDGCFLEYLSGRDNLNFIRKLKNINISNSELEHIANSVNISSFWGDIVINYSHGMRHQLSLALALLIKPRILLLDEPLTSLDPINIKQTKNTLIEYANKDNIVIISTHILPIAQQLGDYILILNDGDLRLIKNLFKNKVEQNKFENFILKILSN